MALALFTVGIYLFGVLTGLAIFYGVLRALPLLQSPKTKKSQRKADHKTSHSKAASGMAFGRRQTGEARNAKEDRAGLVKKMLLLTDKKMRASERGDVKEYDRLDREYQDVLKKIGEIDRSSWNSAAVSVENSRRPPTNEEVKRKEEIKKLTEELRVLKADYDRERQQNKEKLFGGTSFYKEKYFSAKQKLDKRKEELANWSRQVDRDYADGVPYPEWRGKVFNASVDFQKIKTAEIEIPVIAADVLTYEGGELGPAYPDRTRLYYAPEALSDPEYLQTVLRSPLQIQTHEKNTTEYNRGVDGWPFDVTWDETEQRVKARGVLHGEENVRYAEENKNKPNFGTSAFISFLQVDKQSGIAPNGKPYDAIVRKAVNNHIAILPNVRDPKNVILAMNALEGGEMETANAESIKGSVYLKKELEKLEKIPPASRSWVVDEEIKTLKKQIKEREAAGNAAPDDGGGGSKNADPSFDPSMVKTAEEKKRELEELKKKEKSSKNSEGKRMPIDKEDFKAAMNEYEADKAKEAEAKDALKNAVLDELKGGKNTDDKDADDKGKNADDEPLKEKDDAAASNALPSESMVKDFSDALGVTFKKTPSLHELATLAGVQGNTVAELVTALNAKRATLKAPAAKNEAAAAPVSVDDLIKSM